MITNKSYDAMANRCVGYCEIEMGNFDRNSHLREIGDTTDYSFSPDSPSFDPVKYVEYRQTNYSADKNKSPEQILSEMH